MRQERAAIEDFQPDFAGKEYLIDRQLKPEARGDVLNQLRTAGIHPTSMIDISDGLASELNIFAKKVTAVVEFMKRIFLSIIKLQQPAKNSI